MVLLTVVMVLTVAYPHLSGGRHVSETRKSHGILLYFHLAPYSLGCGASCDSSDILA